MKKIFFILALLFFIIGCTEKISKEGAVGEEKISENAKIITSEETYQEKTYEKTDITYEKEGHEFTNYFDPNLRNALEWTKENIEGKFLCWWDYGHMIRGYAGNEVIIFSPSEDILWSLSSGKWDEEKSGKFSSKEKIFDVAAALTAENSIKTREIMQKYNATYVFVTTRDAASSFVLFRIVGLEKYLEDEYKTNDNAESTMLFKMIGKEEINGFTLVYSDELVRIYG